MLEGGDSKPLENHRSISRLVALKPRQVQLAEQKLQKQQPRLTMTKKHLKEQQPSQNNHVLNDNHKPALLHSVIKYISDKGFAKTFKRFLQEAQIEDDVWKANSFDLEDMYCKYLENCRNGDADSKGFKEQEESANGTLLKDAGGDKDVPLETGNNNNKKKNGENDDHAKSSVSEVKTDDPIVELKDKKKKKQKESAYGAMVKDAVGVEDAPLEIDGKKKKKKKKNEENDENAKSSVSEVKKDDSMKEATDKKKKKKSKLASESHDENGTQENSMPAVIEKNVVDRGADATYISLDGNETEPIEKKRKKKVSVSEKLSHNGMEVFDKEKSKDTLDNVTGNKSKKRKRSASDESEDKHVEGVVAEESKKRKTRGAEDAEINAQQAEVETVHQGETKEDNDSVSLMKPRKPSVKQIDESEKGNLKNNGVGRSSEKKIAKKHCNGSAEPNTVNAFQRVKVDEVEFADERLQDNSYWAKGGAENGYGAKAQEVLGQVKGRGFRHEKTKKKRGSYKGGQIDLQSHSVKFNYPDD